MPNCLNCEAELRGPFCSDCGQRVVPRYPSLREMASDAWHEFSGWDGRFARTLRMLIHPGVLTLEILEGRRARYVSPLRLYLAASVMFFLVSAATPSLRRPQAVELPGGGKKIDLTEQLSPEDRALAEEQIKRAPWWVRQVMQPFLDDREGTIEGFRASLPRALFVLLPVFAGIVALFYRRRRFSQHLVFALHLHAAAFVLMSLVQPLNLTKDPAIVAVGGILMLVLLAVYALKAFRNVYRDGWGWTFIKSAAIAPVYVVALAIAMVANFLWSVLT